jgi:nucleotide-binding universal stress UspA family protein
MTPQKLLVPIDFSEISKKVIKLAIYIAKKGNFIISLLHVEKSNSGFDAEEKLKEISAQVKGSAGVSFEYIVKHGNILNEIADTAMEPEYRMAVIGSHGFKGLREKVFGADILKLLKNIPIPVLTIQKDYILTENTFKTILFPASSHDAFISKIKAVEYLAELFGSEVHIYTVEKPGTEVSDKLIQNIKKSKKTFERKNISHILVKEEQTSFSVGYARQILDYAKRLDIGLIALMVNPTREYYYFADADKEKILTNESCVPVLSTNEKEFNH